MSQAADIFQGARLVAKLFRTNQGSRLEFLDDVIASPPEYPGFLATTIPYQTDPIEQVGDNLPPFFLNLLPEGARLQALLSNTQVAADDFLGLLLATGRDTVGDVSVLPPGEAPVAAKRQPKLKRPEDMSFWELFWEGTQPQTIDGSIPGVQEKISSATLTFNTSTAAWPASILKLSPPAYPKLVENEAFFLRMAHACTVPVNKSRILIDREGVSGLLVRRFDRYRAKGKSLQKLHIEDGCQLMGVVPANKYSTSFRRVLAAVQAACTSPSSAALAAIKRYAFSYMIGNADLHAKNVSVIWENGIAALTPGYDLLSTFPYPKLKQNMALPIDGKDLNFSARDFIHFGNRAGVTEAALIFELRAMTQRAERWIDSLGEIGLDATATNALARLISDRRRSLIP